MDIRRAVPIDGLYVRSPPTKNHPNGRKVYLAAGMPLNVQAWIASVGFFSRAGVPDWTQRLPPDKMLAVNRFVRRHFYDPALRRYATWIVAKNWNPDLKGPDERTFWHLRYLASFPYLDWRGLS